jgi:alpha-L-fucosidase
MIRIFSFVAWTVVLLAGWQCSSPAAVDAAPDDSSIQERDRVWASRGCVDDGRGKWFRAAKFGAFIHFGLYSELGGYYRGKGPYDPAEQIMGLGERHMVIPCKEYQSEVGGAFNPTNFDARKWVGLIKRAGQKYLIVTAKHHDGFCMFRTATTKYNVVESTPFGRDVIKELADECRRQGIVFCPYYSIGDWTAAEVMDRRFTSYRDFMFAQLRELMTQYGKIPMLWFDNWWYVDGQWSNDQPHAKELYAWLRSLNPNVLVNDRCGRGAQSTDGDYATPENQLKGELQHRYFEVVMTDTRDDNWGWVRGATNYRSATEIIHNLIDCTSKGGNFVLNVGPTATGEFPAQHVALLNAVGAWLDVNGEAIYGTEPAPECKPEAINDFRCVATKKDRAIYLHVLQWPGSKRAGKVTISRNGLVKYELLDSRRRGLKVTTETAGASLILVLEQPETADPYATVVKLTF